MTDALSPDLSAAIPCHRCGYDVRAQPADGSCPECEALVVESRRMAAIPIRPAWRDSDPRWRRRMLAGVWVLVLVPLMSALQTSGWGALINVPTFFAVQADQSLDNSYIRVVYAYVMFCIGVVLLFSKERNRQRGPLDWTRRWGVITSYLVALIGSIGFAFIAALVILGIAAVGLSMPRAYQPAITPWFVSIGTTYMWYGPHPDLLSEASVAGLSSIVVLLACVPLFNALRSSGPRWLAMTFLLPLAIMAAVQLAYAGLYQLSPNAINPVLIRLHPFFFDPQLLAKGYAEASGLSQGREFFAEVIKWLAILAIAMWLSIAQIAAMCRHRKIERAAV